MEWPKGSGKLKCFPEVDRAAWFDVETAKKKIIKGQLGFIERLIENSKNSGRCGDSN
jgi:predicted NUDIX family NTP pyrophosphohydrolase